MTSMLKAIGLFSFLAISSELQILRLHERLQVPEVEVLGRVLGSLQISHTSNQLHFRPELRLLQEQRCFSCNSENLQNLAVKTIESLQRSIYIHK